MELRLIAAAEAAKEQPQRNRQYGYQSFDPLVIHQSAPIKLLPLLTRLYYALLLLLLLLYCYLFLLFCLPILKPVGI